MNLFDFADEGYDFESNHRLRHVQFKVMDGFRARVRKVELLAYALE